MTTPLHTAVLLTTWNRPVLLRQSLPQIEREAAGIGASLVIADDQSSDPETLELLESARTRGAELIRRPYVRKHEIADDCVHREPGEALQRLFKSPRGLEIVRQCGQRGASEETALNAVVRLWDRRLHAAHVNAQRNNLFGFRHVLESQPRAGTILKVDDDVTLADGAFDQMRSTWEHARGDGHDVLAVAGIRTVNEPAVARFPGYAITHGICNVAVLYRREDWQQLLARTPESRIVRDGFDLAFAWDYAPRHRPGAVALCVTPSVAYHTGRNGLHVRDADLNCEYAGSLTGVTVQ